jgi:ribonucleoside-diphosphate reductase beta chain
MDAAGIKSYVHYIADWPLAQLKLPPVFSYFAETGSGYCQVLSHPLPWLVEILNGVEHANFF